MVVRWGVFSAKKQNGSQNRLAYYGRISRTLLGSHSTPWARGIASENASGLAAVSGGVGWEPTSLWRQTSILPRFRSESYLQKGIVGRFPWRVSPRR